MAEAPSLPGGEGTAMERFKKVCDELGYKDQAAFFFNAYWAEHGEEDAEHAWDVLQYFEQFDLDGRQGGHSLDDFQSARVLEKTQSAMTVIERRKVMKDIDIDTDNRMSMMEYLLWKFKEKVDVLMSRPQGTNEELKRAERALKEVQEEIAKIEATKTKLEADSKGEGVKARRAAAELAALLAADQLELNTRIVKAEAAVRKAQKSKDISAAGTLWFIGRELAEAKKYKPSGGLKKAPAS